MKFCSHGLKVLLGLGAVCGVVEGHQHHHGEEAQVPLHEQEFVQDSADELERKWSFEVRLKFLCLLWVIWKRRIPSVGLVIKICAFGLV
jgi:hypothetical protein